MNGTKRLHGGRFRASILAWLGLAAACLTLVAGRASAQDFADDPLQRAIDDAIAGRPQQAAPGLPPAPPEGAWGEVIRDEDRPTVRAISLQRWTGQFWSGQWEHQTYLTVPATRTGKAAGDGDGESEIDGETEGGVAVAVDSEIEDEEGDLLEAGGSKSQGN